MAPHDVPVVAGMLSTVLFVVSYLPMIAKALRTRDVASYSLGNLLIANVGNGVHSIYVYSLPCGPIWFLHGFYLLSSAVMLACYYAYGRRRTDVRAASEGPWTAREDVPTSARP